MFCPMTDARPPAKYKVGLVQMAMSADPDENLKHAIARVEEGARLTALQGAHILFYPTAIGWHPRERQQHGAEQLDAWRTIQRSHAIANGLFVAAVNRVGHERPAEGGRDRADGIEFWGSSFLADPF